MNTNNVTTNVDGVNDIVNRAATSGQTHAGDERRTPLADSVPTTDVRHSCTQRRGHPRRRSSSMIGRLALGFAVLAGACIAVAGPPASAASAGWRMYDINGDGWNETAAWVDSYGRITQIYSATARGGVYDVYGEVNPSTGMWKSGIWFDTNRNGVWDTYLMRYGEVQQYTAVLSNTRSEFDGLWDDLSLNNTIQCFGQNAKLPLAAMQQDGVFNIWWSSCYDNLRGVGLSGLITGPIYANTFDYLTRATGVGNYCMHHLYGDPTC